MIQDKYYYILLEEEKRVGNEQFGKNFTDWCLSIQREFNFNHPDAVLELSYFRFKRMQEFLIKEQKEMEKSMKRKK